MSKFKTFNNQLLMSLKYNLNLVEKFKYLLYVFCEVLLTNCDKVIFNLLNTSTNESNIIFLKKKTQNIIL